MPLQRLLAAVVLAIIIVLGVIFAVIRVLRLTPVSVVPTTCLSADHVDDIVSAHPPSVYGAHNFRRPNHVITDYDRDVAARLVTLVERRSTAADPDLIRLIVDMLDPPSSHMVKLSRRPATTPQSREVDNILKQKRGGFYVECGALDGVRSSNTLYLERRRRWTGLLVEMDPYFYTQLIGLNRRSWSINACLSPQPYVTQLAYRESSGGAGTLLNVSRGSLQSNNASLVPCFPLHALLVALNQTTVDYLSLDVEGFELEILRTIPFREVDVSVLSVEHVHARSGKQSYVDYMTTCGYRLHKDIHFVDAAISLYVDDFIFVKNTLTAADLLHTNQSISQSVNQSVFVYQGTTTGQQRET